jgi:hypothetical protein
VLAEVAGVLDRVKPAAPRQLLAALSERDGDALALWWDFLRRKSPEALPSAALTRLRGWFEEGKADKDFDDLIAEAEKARPAVAAEQERWPAAVARACVVVGKAEKAGEVLRAAAEAQKTPAAELRLADFYFERPATTWPRRWPGGGWARRPPPSAC